MTPQKLMEACKMVSTTMSLFVDSPRDFPLIYSYLLFELASVQTKPETPMEAREKIIQAVADRAIKLLREMNSLGLVVCKTETTSSMPQQTSEETQKPH